MSSKNRKRQKSLLNYFVVQKNAAPKVVIEAPQDVSSSLEAMSLDHDESNKIISPIESNVNKEQDTPDNTTTPSEQDNEYEDDDIVIPNKRKRRLKRIAIESSGGESGSSSNDDDVPLSVRLSKLKQQQNTKHQTTTVEQCDDIINDEELDFLDKSDILQDRTRGKQVSRYTEALKKLADRKSKLDSYQGERGPIEKYSTRTVHISGSSSGSGSDSNSIEEDELDECIDIHSDSEEDLDGFVVDDDIIDGEKNAVESSEMTMMEMPAEFTTARTQSFSKQLSVYIEYLIVLSLNPEFDILTNSRYKIAKNAVVRRVQSYKDSMVTSDVWLSSFKEAVDKYTNWINTPEEVWDTAIKCEACRANKPASYKVILCSEDEPSQVTFYLGSECCRKGEMYHQFNHFELHMYNKVKNQVVAEMMSDRQQEQQIIHKKMIKSGYIKKLSKQVKDSFNIVIRLYNLRSQRLNIAEDTSSSSSSLSDED